mmetsp:Transcript_100423/g.322122  ORF Transcript_100423/g.322122 Transcript_100423/m.322122 type:complete len:208 (+) Transcript_100423:95-718(+)
MPSYHKRGQGEAERDQENSHDQSHRRSSPQEVPHCEPWLALVVHSHQRVDIRETGHRQGTSHRACEAADEDRQIPDTSTGPKLHDQRHQHQSCHGVRHECGGGHEYEHKLNDQQCRICREPSLGCLRHNLQESAAADSQAQSTPSTDQEQEVPTVRVEGLPCDHAGAQCNGDEQHRNHGSATENAGHGLASKGAQCGRSSDQRCNLS